MKQHKKGLVIWVLTVVALLAASILCGTQDRAESVQEAMRDAVLHNLNQIQIIKCTVSVADAQISLFRIIQIVHIDHADNIVYILDIRIIEIRRIQSTIGTGSTDRSIAISAHGVIPIRSGTDKLGRTMFKHGTHTTIRNHFYTTVIIYIPAH